MSNINTRRNADSATGLRRARRIAAPMLGGMVTAPLLSLLVVPAAYALMRRRRVTPHTEELQRT